MQARDRARILGGLPLGIIKVSRHGNHRPRHGLPEKGFGILLELLEHHRRDLLGRELARLLAPRVRLEADLRLALLALSHLVGDVLQVCLQARVAERTTDEAFRIVDGIGRIRGRLVLRALPDQTRAVRREGDPRGRSARAVLILNHLDTPRASDRARDARVRRAEVDAHDRPTAGRLLGSLGLGRRGWRRRRRRRTRVGDRLAARRRGRRRCGLLERSVGALQPLQQRLVRRIDAQALRVCLRRLLDLPTEEECRAQTRVALGPVGLERDALVCVLDGKLILLERDGAKRPIGVVQVQVARLHFDRTVEQQQGARMVTRRHEGVRPSLELLGRLGARLGGARCVGAVILRVLGLLLAARLAHVALPD